MAFSSPNLGRVPPIGAAGARVTRRAWALGAGAFALLLSTDVVAERVVEVDAGSVHLGDIWAAAPDHTAGLDIGLSPPAGSSRLVLRKELARRLRDAGLSTEGHSLPVAVRIKTRSERWTQERLREQATGAVEASLPDGVLLKRINVRASLVLPSGTVASKVELGRIPRREGEASVSGVLLLAREGVVLRRVPIGVIVDVSAEGAVPLVAKGATLKVYIEKSSAQITAVAEALRDGELGDIVQFRVRATRRVVRAIVESRHSARVVAQ